MVSLAAALAIGARIFGSRLPVKYPSKPHGLRATLWHSSSCALHKTRLSNSSDTAEACESQVAHAVVQFFSCLPFFSIPGKTLFSVYPSNYLYDGFDSALP